MHTLLNHQDASCLNQALAKIETLVGQISQSGHGNSFPLQFGGETVIRAARDAISVEIGDNVTDVSNDKMLLSFSAIADDLGFDLLTKSHGVAIFSKDIGGLSTDTVVVLSRQTASVYSFSGRAAMFTTDEIISFCEDYPLVAATGVNLDTSVPSLMMIDVSVIDGCTYQGRLNDPSGELSRLIEDAEQRTLMPDCDDDFDLDDALDAAEMAADRLVIDIHASVEQGLRIATISRTGIDDFSGQPFINVLEAHVLNAGSMT